MSTETSVDHSTTGRLYHLVQSCVLTKLIIIVEFLYDCRYFPCFKDTPESARLNNSAANPVGNNSDNCGSCGADWVVRNDLPEQEATAPPAENDRLVATVCSPSPQLSPITEGLMLTSFFFQSHSFLFQPDSLSLSSILFCFFSL